MEKLAAAGGGEVDRRNLTPQQKALLSLGNNIALIWGTLPLSQVRLNHSANVFLAEAFAFP